MGHLPRNSIDGALLFAWSSNASSSHAGFKRCSRVFPGLSSRYITVFICSVDTISGWVVCLWVCVARDNEYGTCFVGCTTTRLAILLAPWVAFHISYHWRSGLLT